MECLRKQLSGWRCDFNWSLIIERGHASLWSLKAMAFVLLLCTYFWSIKCSGVCITGCWLNNMFIYSITKVKTRKGIMKCGNPAPPKRGVPCIPHFLRYAVLFFSLSYNNSDINNCVSQCLNKSPMLYWSSLDFLKILHVSRIPPFGSWFFFIILFSLISHYLQVELWRVLYCNYFHGLILYISIF